MKRLAVMFALLIASLTSLPMVWQVVVDGTVPSDVALRRYLVVLAASMVGGCVLAAVVTTKGERPRVRVEEETPRRRADDPPPEDPFAEE